MGIDEEVPFPSRELLGPVIAALFAAVCSLDGLTLNDAPACSGIPANVLPEPFSQHCVNALPRAVEPPQPREPRLAQVHATCLVLSRESSSTAIEPFLG